MVMLILQSLALDVQHLMLLRGKIEVLRPSLERFLCQKHAVICFIKALQVMFYDVSPDLFLKPLMFLNLSF